MRAVGWWRPGRTQHPTLDRQGSPAWVEAVSGQWQTPMSPAHRARRLGGPRQSREGRGQLPATIEGTWLSQALNGLRAVSMWGHLPSLRAQEGRACPPQPLHLELGWSITTGMMSPLRSVCFCLEAQDVLCIFGYFAGICSRWW